MSVATLREPTHTNRLAGRVAIVTGGAGGIGSATARRLAMEGAAVLVADINGDGAAATAREIADQGAHAAGCTVDLASEESVAAMVGEAVARFGGVDVLHNNAALTNPDILGRDGGIVDADLKVWDATLKINLRGTMLACKHAIPVMIDRGGGSIINMSSDVSVVSDAARVAYAVSKGGINTLSLYVATLYGPMGVRCNTICPGMVMTETVRRVIPDAVKALFHGTRLTREPCLPEDIAAAVAFLASDDSRQMTGATFHVDGGMLAPLPMHAEMMALMTRPAAQSA